MNQSKGILITLEGIDNSGKTTQSQKLFNYLQKKNKPVILIREPGGTKISEDIRKLLLAHTNHKLNHLTELLLYEAARAQLVSEVIHPALKRGKIVVCDRFFDSTLAYQGYGRGLDKKLIKLLNKVAAQNLIPHLTLFLDLPVTLALSRFAGIKDRIESEKKSFYNRLRNGYLKIARQESRFVVIDGSRSKLEVWKDLKNRVDNFLNLK